MIFVRAAKSQPEMGWQKVNSYCLPGSGLRRRTA
jgi:hypothetical protein